MNLYYQITTKVGKVMGETFWTRTKMLIKSHETTQRKLALDCGLQERVIENQSMNNRIPKADEAVKIARALNTTVEYLVTGEGDK